MNTTRHAARTLVPLLLVSLVLLAGCAEQLGTSWAGLRLVNGNILVAFNDRVTLLRPIDGNAVIQLNAEGQPVVDNQGNPVRWDVTADEGGSPQFFSSPANLDENTLLLAGYNSRLARVDIATATVTQQPAPISDRGRVSADVLVAGDTAYVGMNADMVALNTADLSERWRVQTGQAVWDRPLLHDGRLYFTSLDHYLYAVDATDGTLLWQLDLGGAATSTPLLHNDSLYVGSFARKLFRISLQGELLAEFVTQDWVWSTPAVAEDTLYFGDLGGTVYALDVSGDGFSEVWRVRTTRGGSIRPTPIVTEDRVIVGSRDRFIYWLSRDNGAEVFSREMDGEILADMLLLEPDETNGLQTPLLIVSSLNNDELVAAYNVNDGVRVWVHDR